MERKNGSCLAPDLYGAERSIDVANITVTVVLVTAVHGVYCIASTQEREVRQIPPETWRGSE